MTSPIATVTRLGLHSAQLAAVAIDRSLGLKHAAVRNASSAVASDRVAARMRADAAAAVAAQPAFASRDLTLVGA